jgi:hypothetical protein
MKLKILSMIAGVAMLAACGPSYRVTDDSYVVVPSGLQTTFSTQYPTASGVNWTMYNNSTPVIVDWDLNGWPTLDASDYVATFNMGSDKYYAYYDANGDWIGTAYVINDYSTLPAEVSNVINNQFSGSTITAVNREMWKDRMAYEIQLKNGNTKTKLLVDSNGNIIKQKSK